MKKEVDLWIEDNEPKGLIYDGDFYYITKKKQVTYKATFVGTPTITKTKISKNIKKQSTVKHHKQLGAIYVGKNDGMRMIKQLLDELKNATNKKEAIKLIKKYYPYASDKSIRRYLVTYEQFAKQKPQTTTQTTITKRRRKKRRRKPAGAYAYSKTYRTWIKEEESNKVLRAVRTVRYGYKPSSITIANETGLPRHRVLATLEVLQDNNKVDYKMDDITPVYFLK